MTFPNLDSPDEAYKQLGVSAEQATSTQRNSSAGSTPDASQLDARKQPSSIDPALLKDNKDWLTASRILYNSTQGHSWDDKQGDEALAAWGLDRMARFNYNLPAMGVDALSIKNAPPEQKKAFLFLLDTFEKTEYSLGGAGRFAKYAAMDPLTYVGLGTFGVGAAAAEGAKLTTLAGLKAALRYGVTTGIEGAMFGAAQQRIEQEARVNAEGQEAVDYGQVGKGAALGAAIGGLLGPGIASTTNAFRKGVKPGAIEPEGTPRILPESEATAETQLTLPLPNMEDASVAAQQRMDKLATEGRIGVPETAEQPTLPGFAQNDLSKPVPFEQLPTERNVNALPPLPTRHDGTPIDDIADRLMKDWDVQHQGDLFPNHAPEAREAPSPHAATIRSANEPALFANLPIQTRDAIDSVVDKAARLDEARNGPNLAGTTPARKEIPVDQRIGNENGPTFAELKGMLQNLGSEIETNAIRGWQAMADATSPLARALSYITPKEAARIATEFQRSAMSQAEFKGFVDAVIRAQNSVASYVKAAADMRAAAVSSDMRDFYQKRVLQGEKVLLPLKELAKAAGTTSGSTLDKQRLNMFKGLGREIDTDVVLKGKGIDPALATDAQRADAIEAWLNKQFDLKEAAEKDARILDLRTRIAENSGNVERSLALWNELAQVRKQIVAEELDKLSPFQKLQKSWAKIGGDVAGYLAATVLSPSTLVISTVSNAFLTFSRPMLDFIGKGADRVAFRQALHAYGAMASVSRGALSQARIAFDTEHSLLQIGDPRFLENKAVEVADATKGNNVTRFLGRNVVRIWLRSMAATDEFFQQLAYAGHVQADAAGKAILAARDRGLKGADEKAFVESYVKQAFEKAYTQRPDATVIGALRDAGIKKGYSGDNLTLYVQNQLDKNGTLLRQATNQEGVDYANDMLMRREFSGDGALSSLAKNYEHVVRQHPELRLIGQLFFRTPVRVFQAGMRLTPLVQMLPGTKFLEDLTGTNGLVRQLRARGELLASYGLATSVVTGVATGSITGDGYNAEYKAQKIMQDASWKPYSIRMADGTYISYRNFDPLATPIKIIANVMERLARIQQREAQGDIDTQNAFEEVFSHFSLAVSSIVGAVREANLTAGVNELIKFGEALNDPERKSNSFKKLFQEKARLLIPNAARKAETYFEPGQNVATDPSTFEQVARSVINPADPKVSDQFDSLGYKRSVNTQGFFPYIGIDAASREARTRGLSAEDQHSLNQIAKITQATGKTFEYPSKVGDLDLKAEMTSDGRMTLFNRAMQEFNKNMPSAARQFFSQAGELPVGRKSVSPLGEAFGRLHNSMWKAAVSTIEREEQKITDARIKQLQDKADVFRGQREATQLFQQ